VLIVLNFAVPATVVLGWSASKLAHKRGKPLIHAYVFKVPPPNTSPYGPQNFCCQNNPVSLFGLFFPSCSDFPVLHVSHPRGCFPVGADCPGDMCAPAFRCLWCHSYIVSLGVFHLQPGVLVDGVLRILHEFAFRIIRESIRLSLFASFISCELATLVCGGSPKVE